MQRPVIPQLSTRDAARRLGTSRAALLRAVRRGEIRPVGRTPGGSYWFDVDDVTKYARRLGHPDPAPDANQLLSLHLTEQHLRDMLAHRPSAAWVIDDAGTFTIVNAALCMLCGYTAEELLGAPYSVLIAETADAGYPPRTVWSAGEQTLRARDGRHLTVHVTTTMFSDVHGRRSWVSIAASSPSYARTGTAIAGHERAWARWETERAHLEAEALVRMRSDFVAAVSHELRTPLTTIVGYAELLQAHWGDIPEAARLHHLGHIVRAALRQQRLVEDLLLLSRLESFQEAPHTMRVPVAPLVRRAIDEVAPRYCGQRVDVDGAPDFAVLADPDRLAQVLVHLLDNAAKHSPESEPIGISWRLEQGLAAIRVQDCGPGVPEVGRSQLFTRFGRIPGSRSRAGRVGTGLGLYLSRHLARAMDGDLDLESTGPAGSVFLLRLRPASG